MAGNYSHYQKEIGPGSVFDSHCHLEFYRWRGAPVSCLSDCMQRDGDNLGEKFRGCIVNFCYPEQWSRGVGGKEVSKLLREAASGTWSSGTGCWHPSSPKMVRRTFSSGPMIPWVTQGQPWTIFLDFYNDLVFYFNFYWQTWINVIKVNVLSLLFLKSLLGTLWLAVKKKEAFIWNN